RPDTHGDVTDFGAFQQFDILYQVASIAKQRSCLLHHDVASPGRYDTRGRSLEQLKIQLVLQRLDAAAQGRLRNAEPIAGRCEAALLGQRDGVAQLAKIDISDTHD